MRFKKVTSLFAIAFVLAIGAVVAGNFAYDHLKTDELETEIQANLLTSDELVPSEDPQQQLLNLMTDLQYDERRIQLQQVPVTDLRLIVLIYEDGERVDRFVHRNNVDKFVEASLELHHQPGINPHNGGQTAKITRISVAEPDISGPYWWSTPGLQQNYDPEGVPLIDWYDSEVVWELIDS